MIDLFWRRKWKKSSAFLLPGSVSLLLLLSLPFLFLYFSYTLFPKTLLHSFPCHPFPSSSSSCGTGGPIPPGRFLWYAPHSGFSNQLSEFKNALLFAAILNRTLIVPPVLDHHSVALGSCPKFRVSSPTELRMAVWDHGMELVWTRRKRRDLLKSLGTGSNADKVSVLSFGSLFTAPYKGSELYIDIHEVPEDGLVQLLLQNVKFLPYVPEIVSAGKEFAKNKIKMPFLCAQLSLLDGQFKNHWKATFFTLKQKVDLLVKESTNNPISIFVMTDLPKANWSKTYLGELEQSDFVKLFILQEEEDLVRQTANRLMTAEHGIRSGYYPKTTNRMRPGTNCGSVVLPDVLLYIEQSVCSCASLGFVGTAGSTIAASIELMRERANC